MADIKADLENLVNKVGDQTTVIDSVKTVIDDLHARITAAQGQLDAAGEDEVSAKLGALADALKANTDRLAAAVAENTGAGDEVHAASM